MKDQRSIPALLEVVYARGTQPDGVRQVAAVLLYKRISGHYKKFPADFQVKLRTELLQFLASESIRSVRNAITGVVSSICKVECDNLTEQAGVPWPELFQFISAASQDANPEARELAFLLLFELTDTIGFHMKSQFNDIAQLFQNCLVSEQELAKVKNAAVKALGGLLSFLVDETENDVFCNLIPALLQVSHECQKRQEEETVSNILDVLYDLAYSPSRIVTAHMSAIVRFCLGCLADSSLDMNVRDSAALVVATFSESKSKTFGKDQSLMTITLETLFSLLENSDDSAAGALFECNPEWKEDIDENYDPGDDLDSPTETSMAQGTMDMIACQIPKKYVFQQTMEMCISRLQSTNANHRKAGIACLGVIAEGCAEPFRVHLPEIMPHILNSAKDPSVFVRECACFALGQLSEHCQPEVMGYSEQVLPIVFSLLDDATITVQATSCYVLEMFCEKLEPERVRPFLKSLTHKLSHMLETTNKRMIQVKAVAALAATALAAEEEFVPYVAGVANLMSKLMVLTEERMLTLRGHALECMGHIAIAVGKDHFRPYFPQTMQCACEGLTQEAMELHEFAYLVFANLSKVMGEEFSPCLPELVPHLLKVIEQDEGTFEALAEENKGELGNFDDSDDEGEDTRMVLQVRTALLEAKKGAITAISEISSHCGAAFAPYLEQTVPLLQKSANNLYSLMKADVAEALASLINTMMARDHEGKIQWEKGDISGANPMSPATLALVTIVLQELTKLMKDEDTETVGKVCISIQDVIEKCGPHSFAIIAKECLENTHSLLIRKAPCQIIGEDEGFDDDFDDDHDSYMTSVCDLVGSFARVMGSHFIQYLPQFIPAICNYAKPSRPSSDRAMAIGCLGELAEEIGVGIADYWKSVYLPAILSGLADEDNNLKRNAAFCAGVSCEVIGAPITPDYTELLQTVGTVFSVDASVGDTNAACVDNAAACIARMIMTSPSSVPLEQVLPVFLKSLPLKNDMTENETVYTCILGLIEMKNQNVIPHQMEIKRIFIEATSEESEVDDEIQQKLKLALTTLG